jgi:hypothetical protein
MSSAAKSQARCGRLSAATLQDLSVWLLLIASGIAARLIWADLPNFKPLAGMALFAGYYFCQTRMAATVPLTILLLSDWWLGGYQPVLRLAVYGALLMPVLLAPLARQALRTRHASPWMQAATAAGTLGACAVGSSVFFFLVTNFCTWLVTPWYARTAQGLGECYVAALPFFRYTVTGDVLFTLGLFGSWQLATLVARRIALSGRPRAATEIAA